MAFHDIVVACAEEDVGGWRILRPPAPLAAGWLRAGALMHMRRPWWRHRSCCELALLLVACAIGGPLGPWLRHPCRWILRAGLGPKGGRFARLGRGCAVRWCCGGRSRRVGERGAFDFGKL